MIQLKDVCAGYGGKKILDSVSFGASDGEITVILGKNGCGKSTLLRAVSGNLKYGGSITLDGLETGKLNPSQRAKMLSAMPQMLRSPGITVRSLVSFGRQPYTGLCGILSKADRDIVERVIDETGLAHLAEKRLDQISGGELQKAYFAMLLAQDTPNLTLDEPSSHLDAEYIGCMADFLTSAKNAGKAVLAVLHDINHTVSLADKIVFLGDGGVIFSGSRRGFIESGVAEERLGLIKYVCPGDSGERIFYG